MKSLYTNQGMTIGKYAAVSLDANDKMVVGPCGWIFKTRDSRGRDRLGVVYCTSEKSEKITYHDFNELASQVFRIKRFTDPAQRAEYANNPNLRYKRK
jgi:hypothetical protein